MNDNISPRQKYNDLLYHVHKLYYEDKASISEIHSYLNTRPLSPDQVTAILQFVFKYEFGYLATEESPYEFSSLSRFYDYIETLQS